MTKSTHFLIQKLKANNVIPTWTFYGSLKKFDVQSEVIDPEIVRFIVERVAIFRWEWDSVE